MRRIHLSRPDFTAVSKDRAAKRGATSHFSIVISAAGIGTAVVVSKKVAKSSVERHVIKRRVREAVAQLSKNTKRAIIVYAKAGAGTLPYSEIVSELETILAPRA